jgi:hypothetical protein
MEGLKRQLMDRLETDREEGRKQSPRMIFRKATGEGHVLATHRQ